MTLQYVTITSLTEDASAANLNGTVTITPSATVYSSGIPVLVVDSPIQAQVIGGQLKTASGAPLTLLATDNTGLVIEGQSGFWFYTVAPVLGGQVLDSWVFQLPSSPSSRDLYSLSGTGVSGVAYLPLAGGTMSGPIAMGSSKVTGIANGSAAQDAAAFGQLPSASSPLGTAAGGSGASYGTLALLLAALLAAGGGTMGAELAPKVVALTDAATVLVNAALGNDFYVTLGGNRTMGAPSNPADGQKITFEVIQDGTGSRTLTWTGGAGGYAFGSGTAPTLSTAAGATDQAAFRYSARKNAWLYLGTTGGF